MMYTVTLDLDGTLLRSPFWRMHLRPWLEQLGSARHRSVEDLWADVRRVGDARWQCGKWVESFDWGGMIEQLFGVALSDPPVPDFDAARRLMMPYLDETIGKLLDLPVQYAVVTNGFYRYQAPYLEALHWNDWLCRLITPDQSGAAKPDPRAFADLGPVLCHVGDRPEHDTLAAHRAGVVSVQCGPRPRVAERADPMAPPVVTPDIAMADMRELPGVIRTLLDRPWCGVVADRSRGPERQR